MGEKGDGAALAMLAGQSEDLVSIRPLLAPVCKAAFSCGAVPGALLMKLAVNVFLITMATGLAEARHFAHSTGLDMAQFFAVLAAGPMASDVSRVKAAKLRDRDFARQTAISDVLKNARLVADAAREAGIALPLIDACYALYGESEALDVGEMDVVAVINAIEARTAAPQQHVVLILFSIDVSLRDNCDQWELHIQ